jgi:hypothetical protein
VFVSSSPGRGLWLHGGSPLGRRGGGVSVVLLRAEGILRLSTTRRRDGPQMSICVRQQSCRRGGGGAWRGRFGWFNGRMVLCLCVQRAAASGSPPPGDVMDHRYVFVSSRAGAGGGVALA